MNTPTITYAITVCNEKWELERLLGIIQPYLQKGDQVLIQSDADQVTDEVLNIINQFISQYRGGEFIVTHESIPLNGDFGAFKNNLKSRATGQWIFQIDADEYPTDSLLTGLLYVLSENRHVDVILVPRINTVDGITQEHVDKWNWKVEFMRHPLLKATLTESRDTIDYVKLLTDLDVITEKDGNQIGFYKPVINFPDYQWRLYRNIPDIKWVNPVHERLTGFEMYATLPADITWCLMHHKEINRQEYQNEFYDKINAG